MNGGIVRAQRAIVRVRDLEAARRFYVETLGFIETEKTEECLYLRGLEERSHHCYVLKKSDAPGVEFLGYRVSGENELYQLAERFEKSGQTPRWYEKGSQRAIGDAFRVYDCSGIPLEFFYEIESVPRLLQRYTLYRGARMQRIDHFNCFVPDVEKAHRFYIDRLGFRCSEYTVTEDDRIWASWLFRKPSVHDIAFMNGEGPRLHHVGFWLSDPMSVIGVCDILAAAGYADSIERGPGRHGLSNAFFLYLRDPDGNRIELYTGDYFTGDPDFRPIRWDLNDPQRATFWGQAAPDSWFQEAKRFVRLDGEGYVATKPGCLIQQKPHLSR